MRRARASAAPRLERCAVPPFTGRAAQIARDNIADKARDNIADKARDPRVRDALAVARFRGTSLEH